MAQTDWSPDCNLDDQASISDPGTGGTMLGGRGMKGFGLLTSFMGDAYSWGTPGGSVSGGMHTLGAHREGDFFSGDDEASSCASGKNVRAAC